MRLTYHDLKSSLYMMLTAFGIFLILLSWQTSHAIDPTWMLVSIILLLGGLGLILFGLVTYALRDDPDVWR